MHFQTRPAAETKLVRVIAGAVWDVVLDLREQSPTFLRWWGMELAADNRQALLIPTGCAHGYQTLADRTQVMYQTTHRYVPEAASGVAHDDPVFGIDWPLPVSEISAADTGWAQWQDPDERRF
jgi:dTDP-4-dehydrorhamnose 3,5-epimerase